jgi:hypothetical protein
MCPPGSRLRRSRASGGRAVAHQPLAPEVVAGGDGDAGVQVEAVVFDGAFVDGRPFEPGSALLLGLRVVANPPDSAAIRLVAGARSGDAPGVGR